MTGTETRRIIGDALREIVESAKSGGPRTRVGLMASGSELGPEELARRAVAAQEARPGLEAVMHRPRNEGLDPSRWTHTPD